MEIGTKNQKYLENLTSAA